MADGFYSTRDAARMVGDISEATLRGWAKAAGIRTSDDPTDQRVRGWTHDELEHEVDLLKERVARLEAHLGLV